MEYFSMILKTRIAVLAGLLLLLGSFAVKYDVVEKAQHIGNRPTEALVSLYQLLTKDGLLSTWETVLSKLNNDPRLGLKYSLFDRATYPPLESVEERDTLPEYKIIPGVDVGTLPPSRDTDNRYETWHRSNGDNFSSKYSSLDQIRRNNVKDLKVAWTYSSGPYQLGEASWVAVNSVQSVQSNPVVVNGKLFVASINGQLISLDAVTGRENWRVKLPPPVARRGLIWEPNPDFSKSRLFVPTGWGVYAINAATGEIQRNFGDNGQVGDQLSLIAPVIAGEKLIIAINKPALEAYDLRTGKHIWTRRLLLKPDANNALITGGVPWAGMSFDPSRFRVYVSTGNPRPEVRGVTRPGANHHSNSVVAVDANSGEIIWAFQEVAHDLWDLDVPSPPVLTTIKKGGRKIDVVAVVTKLGNTLLLDRDLGKPIFDYKMKRAPVSKMPGEQTWPYQPSIELPEPFSKPIFQEKDVTDISKADRQAVLQKIRGAKLGFFEPPVLGGKVVLNGIGGGAEWPGAAIDPNTGILYVPSNQTPHIVRANYVDLKVANRSANAVPGNAMYLQKCSACHGVSREGFQEAELKGGRYFPPLMGITILRSREELIAQASFNDNHSGLNLSLDVSDDELNAFFNYFSILDKVADNEKSFSVAGFWSPLVDSLGYPGTKPPWGYLTALDLNSGKKVWQVPFGEYQKLRRNGAPVKGQPNVGGAIVTAGGLVFATGTLDGKVRSFDAANGKELWSFELPALGSAPPTTYMVDGTQYLVVVTSARTHDLTSPHFDKIVAFKLSERGRPRK